MKRFLPAGALCLLVAACGDSTTTDAAATGPAPVKVGDSRLDQVPDAGPCDALTTASAQWIVETTCTGCAVENAAAAVDGSEQTFATVTFAASARTGGAALRATFPPGVVYQPGHGPGALVRHRGDMPVRAFPLRTYLGGVLQEEQPHTGATFGGGGEEIRGFVATLPFDAIEYYINAGPTPTGATAEIVELCLDAY